MELDWIDLKVDIDKRDLLDVFFRTQTHKTVNRHGSQEWKCNLHEEAVNNHLMSVEYRRCASVSCRLKLLNVNRTTNLVFTEVRKNIYSQTARVIRKRTEKICL